MTVRVLVVDDSATMRRLIRTCLETHREIEVVGEAANPVEARHAIKALNPEVITLDIEMPKMNGLDFLEKIMRLRPTPVIMVSSLTRQGAEATIAALAIGAFDCVAKPALGSPDTFAALPEKVLAAAEAKMRPLEATRTADPRSSRAKATFVPNSKIVAIGSSTGGVEALLSILSEFPSNCPPTVVTQHMPSTFTRSFADRLNRACAADVCEAFDGAPLTTGRIYIAPGGLAHLKVVGAHAPRCSLHEGELVSGHRPSVDVLFQSVAATVGANAVGVILTGMGSDGAKGLLAMRQAGASTLGQDHATSVVFGMPRVAFEIGAVEQQVALDRLAACILETTRRTERQRI